MKEFKEWDGFEGKIWKEINTRISFRRITPPYDGDESFWQVLLMQPISFGASCRNFRKKSVPIMAF